MTTFTINEQNEIVAHATPEEAAAATATPFDTFASEQEFRELAAQWPAVRLLAIWNSLPGVKPVQKIRKNQTVMTRIWARVQKLGETPQPKAPRKAHGRARVAQGAPVKGKAKTKASAPKASPKGKRRAGAPPAAPRPGSKSAQVVALLQRKNGATISEIMAKMNWQKHTVRGFMAGAMKKAGYTVASFKPEGGERSYRLQ